MVGLMGGAAVGQAPMGNAAYGGQGAVEPVNLSVGLLPLNSGAPTEQIAARLEETNLFRSVEAVRSKKEQGIDVFITVQTNMGQGWSPDSMRPNVIAVSAYSRKTLYTGRPACGWTDQYCINVKNMAEDLARAFAEGTDAYEQIMAEKQAASQPAPAAPPSSPAPPAEPVVNSDVDRPGYKNPENPDRFALVIGIGRYKSLPEAKFAVRDAETMREHLIALGYPRRNVITLTGDNATRTGMQKYLEEWLPRNVGPQASVFFYYSGHGAPDPKSGEAFLVPWDGDAQFLQSTAYPLTQLYSSLGKLKAKHVLVALDSCFSGAGGRSVLANGARPLVTKVDVGVVPQGRLTVFSAASGDEITGTLDDQGHGMFTYFFLKGLSAKQDGGAVTAQGLFDYLKPHVQDEARRQNREQTPLLLGSKEIDGL